MSGDFAKGSPPPPIGSAATQKPTLGRIVHYVLDMGSREGEVRTAIVSGYFGPSPENMANLKIIFDGPNDISYFGGPFPNSCADWRGSVHQDESGKKPGTWHWPPRA